MITEANMAHGVPDILGGVVKARPAACCGVQSDV
jgi:hypothetical protein